MIEHTNIIYMPTISALGGIETYVYELVKKYHDLDIAVVSKNCDLQQAKRIKRYCKLYIWNGEKIKCKVAIINYDQSIIDFINEDAEIYQTIHADYTNPIYKPYEIPKPHPRIKAFLGITKYLTDRMADVLKPNKIELCYNPLTIDDENKTIVIVSATRLHKNKGVDRMIRLAQALDNARVNYIWYVLSNDTHVIDLPNVIMIKNRLDISRWLGQATYVCLLSNSEACSYTLNEALYRNIPIITTPLPYLEEIGYKDGKTGYTIEFDCSNIDDVVKKIPSVPSFNFKRLEDNYKNIFKKSKNKYKEELGMKVKVRCIVNEYYDTELGLNKVKGDEYIVSRERADRLMEYPALVEEVEIVNEVKKEDKKKPTKKVEKK